MFREHIKKTIGTHYIFVLYSLVILGLLIGLSQGFDAKYSLYVLFLYLLPFALIYFAGYAILKRKNWTGERIMNHKYVLMLREKSNPTWVLNILMLGMAIIFVWHGIIKGGYPGFEALSEFRYRALVFIRKEVTTDLPVIFKYLYSFVLKAIIPFSIVYAYWTGKNKYLIPLFILAYLFGINAMQKSNFMTFFLPLTLLLLYQKKYKQGIVLFVFIMFSIFTMVFITNPSLKYSVVKHFSDMEFPSQNEGGEFGNTMDGSDIEDIGLGDANEKAVNSIFLRTVYLPGKTVGKWFDAIPQEKPFLNGTGYRVYARLANKEYHNYSTEMYPVLYPHYAKRGYSGSVNTASFMYDYANFKLPGLVMSAFFMAVILLLVTLIFQKDFMFSFSFNTMPVLLLSSVSYTTLLYSGGWGIIILLFILLLKKEPHEATR